MTEIKLRDFQQQAVQDIRAAFAGAHSENLEHRNGHEGKARTVLFVLPTGGGKTFSFAFIATKAAERGNRVLIIAHRKELIRQASCSLAALGVFHQVVAPKDKIAAIRRAHIDKFDRPFINRTAHVAVASIQTLARRLPWLKDFNPALVIPDEAHHAVAGTWKKALDELPDARVLGVTATPGRADGQGLGDVFEVMVRGPQMAWLIDQGYLVPARVFRPPLRAGAADAMAKVGRRGGDLDAQQQAAILDNASITGDAVQHYNQHAPGKATIVFCASVNHARHVAAQFQAAGWKFTVVTGDMDDGERDRAIFGLASGAVHGIVTVDVVSEGVDIPFAEVAILLRRTESESLYLQQVGRVLRPTFADGYDVSDPDGRLDAIANSEKHYGLILDHVGNTEAHGLPHAERNWSLDSEKRSRGGGGATEGPKMLQCANCYHVHEPRRSCPECGYEYEAHVWNPPKQDDSELEEVSETEEQIKKIQARRAQGQARDLKALKAQGMSTGRAQHILAARAEKERLQGELSEMMRAVVDAKGAQAPGAIGYKPHEIKTMKPKQLREEIDRLGGMLFGFTNNEDETDEREHALEDSAARRA